jgi:predicted DCC family thiol-disulfide oxidoreductase YuxK
MREPINHPVLLVDGTCSLCNGAVRLILKLEARPFLRFAALESDYAQELLKSIAAPDLLPDSIVLIDEQGWYVKSQALMRIGIISGGWLSVLRLAAFLPAKWVDTAYDFVARNRIKWFGNSQYCAKVPLTERYRFIDL